METPTTEPTTIRAGDSIAWERELSEYSADDGWTLKYKILWPVGSPASFDATGVATLHSVALSAADTETYTAGRATLAAYVEKGSGASLERATLQSVLITVLPSLAAAEAFDGRSANVIALANARAALAAYMAKGQLHVASYDVGGRTMTFRAANEITALIAYYEREVFKETAAAAMLNGVSPGRVRVRM